MGSAAVERGAVLKKSPQIEKIATLADRNVRSFGCSATSEAAVLGYSTVGARHDRLLVECSAINELGAQSKVGIFQVCKST